MMRVGAVVLILLLAAGLGSTPWLRRLDLTLLDAQFQVLRTHALRPIAKDSLVHVHVGTRRGVVG